VDLMNRCTVSYVNDTEHSARTQLPSGETLHGRVRGEVIITTSSVCTLRIVSLGVAASGFTFTALEYLVNHWRVPEKLVQFVTNGEMEKEKFLDFWTSACINQLVSAVQFVNLQRYLPFGYYKGKCKKLNKTTQVEQRTDRPARPARSDTQHIDN